MSTPIFTRAMKCISVLSLFLPLTALADWKLDLSRRQDFMSKPTQMGAINSISTEPSIESENSSGSMNMIDRVFESTLPTQDIVIINTEQGFIPTIVRVKEGARYRLVIVNVNEKARNVSFVMDSFSEHHATFYGKAKSFYINPKKEGVYTFISPETSAQGRLVVYPAPAATTTEMRAPANANE